MIYKEKIYNNGYVSQLSLGNYGRLGNQLFQYAALQSLSIKNNVLPIIPKNEHRLNNFQITAIEIDYSQLSSLQKTLNQYVEPFFNFNPLFFECTENTNIHGYFQSEKYFINIAEFIKKEFQLKDPKIRCFVKEYIKEIKQKNKSKSLVSIHIRRGDNVPTEISYTDKISGVFMPNKNEFHPLLSEDYIIQSKKYFPNSIFLIFSDSEKDISWCKEHFSGEDTFFSKPFDDITDFALMSSCDHNIIANSSFSWWAAWLNENPEKLVICPKTRWFGNALKQYNTCDLFPEGWILL